MYVESRENVILFHRSKKKDISSYRPSSRLGQPRSLRMVSRDHFNRSNFTLSLFVSLLSKCHAVTFTWPPIVSSFVLRSKTSHSNGYKMTNVSLIVHLWRFVFANAYVATKHLKKNDWKSAKEKPPNFFLGFRSHQTHQFYLKSISFVNERWLSSPFLCISFFYCYFNAYTQLGQMCIHAHSHNV